MMDFENQGKAISNRVLISRTTQAAVKVANAVMAESGAAAGHTQRAAFAQRVLYAPEDTAKLMVRTVATNSNFGDGTTDDPNVNDNALEFVITSSWNAYSNYSANP